MPVLVKAEKVQGEEENNELLAENLNRRRQQLFKQEMGSRLKSKINATAAILPSGCYYIGCTIGPEGSTNQDYKVFLLQNFINIDGRTLSFFQNHSHAILRRLKY